MHENGNEKKTNIWSEVAGQVSDHVDLATLELRYEAQQVGKKFFAFAAIFVLVLTGFIVLQAAVIGALMKVGLSMGLSALILAAVYFAFAVGIGFLVRRNKRAGPPFAATQRELHETLKWIQKVLS